LPCGWIYRITSTFIQEGEDKNNFMFEGLKNISARCLPFLEKWHSPLSVLFFILILAVFGYAARINYPPQSTHVWRQSDCASIALNYYQDGMRFFHPEIHNNHADNGTSGHSVSEAPFLYYTVALLYNVFGYHHWVYRGLWTLILIAGFFGLYRFFHAVTGSAGFSFPSALIIINAPVIIFYGNSFMPDVPALAFTFVGWMFFARWMMRRNNLFLYLTALFFILGGLLKITALISFFSLAGVWLLELAGAKMNKTGKVFPGKWKSALPFLAGFIILLAWYLWAWRFNEMHDTRYFSMRTCPIWNLSSCITTDLADVRTQILQLWMPHLFSRPLQVFFVMCALGLIIFARHANRMLLTITAFTFAGSLSYILIWFAAFRNHDYYFINLYIFPAFLLLTTVEMAVRLSGKYRVVLLFVLAGLALHGIWYTTGKQRLRYDGWMNYEYRQFASIRAVAPYIDELGIEPDDLVVSLPDRTSGYTLYHLNRRGWTRFYNQAADSASLALCIKRGAKFLFLTDYDNLISQHEYLASFTSHPAGFYDGLHIFRIDGNPHPKKLTEIADTLYYKEIYAHELYDDPALLSGSGLIPGEGNSGSNAGKGALLLNSERQFGFNTRVPVFTDSRLSARIWKRSPSGKGMLVVTADAAGDFYHSSEKPGGHISGEWQQEVIDIKFGSKPGRKEVIIYAWNPSGDYALFDRLEILIARYRPGVAGTCSE
jgi:hypothetical protein